MMNKVFASNRSLAALAMLAPTQVGAVSVRSFAAKKQKKASGSDGETEVPRTSRFEGFEVSTSEVNLDASLFQAFSLGDIKKVNSTPDNKAPSSEDTIEGRYAGVLFTTASQKSALYDVYEDMMYLSQLYTHSESFRLFTENAGVGQKEIRLLNQALLETAPFHEVTIHFLVVLAENKRLVSIQQIASKYQKLYQQFNKEEKITIISAEELTSRQQSEVLSALQANP